MDKGDSLHYLPLQTRGINGCNGKEIAELAVQCDCNEKPYKVNLISVFLFLSI